MTDEEIKNKYVGREILMWCTKCQKNRKHFITDAWETSVMCGVWPFRWSGRGIKGHGYCCKCDTTNDDIIG